MSNKQEKTTELLTIKEFSVQAGVTPQTIYNYLSKDLKPYLQVINGRKYLSADGLKALKIQSKKSSKTGNDNTSIDSDLRYFYENELLKKEDLITDLMSQIKDLQTVIKSKDAFIEQELSTLIQQNNALIVSTQALLNAPAQENKTDPEQEKKRKGFFGFFKG